jgi:DNA polymerase-3 subunit epsilon
MRKGHPRPTRERTLRLAAELEAALRERESLPASEACRLLFRTDRIPAELALPALDALVASDRRFLLGPEGVLRLAAPQRAPRLPLVRLRYTVLDLETTGGSPAEDRILEVGAVRVERGRVRESFATLVNPGVPIPDFISSMTGIRPEMAAAAPPFRWVAERVAEFIGDSVVVAHNLPFDFGFLNRELERACGFVLTNPTLCTVRLGRRLLPGLPDRRLDTLADACGFKFEARHRALGDARVTALLLIRFLELLAERGVIDWAGIEAFLAGGAEAAQVSGPPRRRGRLPTPSSAGS